MNKQLLKDTLGWGFILWLVGYILGFIFFFFVPTTIIGWVIMPFGVAVTLWVLLTRIKSDSLRYFLILSVAWTLIAVLFDYFFLVKLLHPADGYYKIDVYIYYLLTFAMPLAVGWWKARATKQSS